MTSAKPGKSGWEKADILLKGLLPVAVAAVGYWGTSYLAQQQRTQTTAQFYSDLITKREAADISLRKELFKNVMDKFLGASANDLDNQVLGLELLAYNFNDSFDLGPLFKAVYRRILKQPPEKKQSPGKQQSAEMKQTPEQRNLVRRLETVSKEIIDRQVASLASDNYRWGVGIDSFQTLHERGYMNLTNQDLPAPADAVKGQDYTPLNMHIEALAVNTARKTIHVRLQIRGRKNFQTLIDASFWVSYFDFPMLDNIRLPDRQRLAVVLRQFDADSAQMMIVYFPESRASLKEKPYFDDLIEDMKRRSIPK